MSELKKQNTYGKDSIETLEFKEAMRKRVEMYMGSADNQGVLQVIREVITNSIDEATSGYGDKIIITLDRNKVQIEDFGRGCPFGVNNQGVEVLQAIFTQGHAGGKFSNDNYKKSAGLFGIGAKGAGLTSIYCNVISRRAEGVATLEIEKGDVKSFDIVPKTNEHTGTIVCFKPDPEVYNIEPITIKPEDVQDMCKTWAYLHSGVKFIVIDKISNTEVEYHYPNGIKDLIVQSTGKGLHKEPIYKKEEGKNIDGEVALYWTTDRRGIVEVFTNGLGNPEGGTSLTGVKTALTNFFKKYEKDVNKDVIWNGLNCVISCGIDNPSFANQTKTKVNNPELRILCYKLTMEALEDFRKDTDSYSKVIESLKKQSKAEVAAQKARDAVLIAQKDIKNVKKRRAALADKLKDCKVHGYDSGSILGIVEGDSACGGLSMGRPIENVALLPIRGKIISALKNPQEKILSNEEVKAIFYSLGCGFFDDYNPKKLRYEYLGIMVDADKDGLSIAMLLISLMYYMCPQFLKEGRLVWVRMPLYKVSYTKTSHYAFDEIEKDKIIASYGKPKTVTRFKGLGEYNPDDVKEAVFGDSKRWERLIIDDFDAFSRHIAMMMGTNVRERRDYIMENVDFTQIGE